MKICITGGIACGKSLVARYLRENGFETLDADDVVHEIIPEDERKRLAREVFRDAEARRALEARIHPLVRSRLEAWQNEPSVSTRIVIIPLLFETHWDKNYDIICCIASEEPTQTARMMSTRGYTREEAEARLAAQMPVAEKVAKSHYVINNNGSTEALRQEVEGFIEWLKSSMYSQTR